MTVNGTVWWTELMTRDVPAALRYYSDVCGWTFEKVDHDTMTYHIGSRDGQPSVGVMDITGMDGFDGLPAHWFSYFAVDDLGAALERSAALGGKVGKPPFAMPGVGRIAIVIDPTGAAMGLIEPETA
ncbi:hypothetical protein C8N32_11064 [Rhodovulum imhoffii]|uniref:VOC domain-containing protein n=1 Tax=Rhodovulum imhoffii TaxID=365340 RepID=A0A2T5BR99_9RHOB|nr:VOC family protein [Rhodovulum imhoffii]PTN01783.1 hypothetical protein C8N32_11064 [Rhodovulum imhoffii]